MATRWNIHEPRGFPGQEGQLLDSEVSPGGLEGLRDGHVAIHRDSQPVPGIPDALVVCEASLTVLDLQVM